MKTALYVRRTLITAALLAASYTVFGFLAVPAILERQAVHHARDTLQRKLSIGKVTFNPFTLVLSIDALILKEPKSDVVFVSADHLALDLSGESVWRLAPVVERATLTQPYVHLQRTLDGSYNIADILSLMASQPASPDPARFSINNIELAGGKIVFDDLPAKAVHTVQDLRLGVPSLSSMPAQVHVFVEPLLSAKVNGAPLKLTGKVRPFAEPKDMALDLALEQVDLPRYLAYLPFKPAFTLSGAHLDLRLRASFRQPRERGPALLIGGTLALKDVGLVDMAGNSLLKLRRLDLDLGALDIFAGRFDVQRLALDGLDATVSQDAQGQLNWSRLALVPPSATPAAKAAPASNVARARLTVKDIALRNSSVQYAEPGLTVRLHQADIDLHGFALDSGGRSVTMASIGSPKALVDIQHGQRAAANASITPASEASQSPYSVKIDKIALRDWALALDERSHGDPSQVTLSALHLKLDGYSNAPGARMRLDLQSGAGTQGRLAARGTLGLAPLHADLALDIDKLSLLPLQAYATEAVNLRLTQALLGVQGHLQLGSGADGARTGGFKGSASIDQLATVDKSSNSDFVSWKALGLTGMDVRFAPLAVSIDKVALSDFFARVIIDPNGRINLQDVRRQAAGERSLTDAGERASAPLAASATAPASAANASQPLPPIKINSVALSGGRVRFTDNFIRPNYTASLKALGGSISGLSSAPEANATLDLTGSVNSAPLAIAGRINPLRKNLFLDVKAEVRGIELSTLSAYADKYVGYGIDKGKMSFEVAYLLENRQLTSQNRLMLDQLTFGRESSNPDAPKMPVGLAVALLSDRNGMIDISVPIGGTLDDPQFSVGGIVLKIVGNAIMKAVTSPFALLASAFGGGEELSSVDFDAGYATINQGAETRLAALSKALLERPGLKLDIVGRANPALDQQALKRVAIERKMRTLKSRDLQAAGTAMPTGQVVVSKDEYPALLARVFKEESFAKPRNAIGLNKTLTQEEMQALLLANTSIGPDDLLALARRRSQAAKDWLATSGQVPVDRLYIVAAQGADGSGEGAASAAARAEFTLR